MTRAVLGDESKSYVGASRQDPELAATAQQQAEATQEAGRLADALPKGAQREKALQELVKAEKQASMTLWLLGGCRGGDAQVQCALSMRLVCTS